VGRAEAGGAVEAEVGQLRQPEQRRQVEVRFVLPAARPDQLEARGQPLQALARRQRDEVGEAVDQLEAGDLGSGALLEAEERDDAVDVDGQDRLSYQR
jgi:hypothetical protein